ncbi:glycosyltransferase [Halobaculum sp. WSA2]|uniref:Glycosyltransferase n=1 Tax=Halobaculum saliterrae TaxID=2073113 RepID=A0A6B0T0U6_9EURY|nr:glycosyltransferase family 4 protein [Halobaculum saliterrae]MXR41870.1 glycosyltransferase [Halobaculum saliterrae]
MNIGIYSPRVGFANSGGTETVVRELTKQLTGRHDITLYTGTGNILPEVERMDADIVQVDLIPKESRLNERVCSYTPLMSAEVESLSMFWNVLRSDVRDALNREDIVSTHYYLDNLLLSRTLSVPNVFHIPGIRHSSIRWKLMGRFAQPDSYLATSKDTKQRAEDWLGVSVDGIVYPSVDRDQFNPDVKPAVTEDDPIVMFVGRLQDGKGVPDLLDAYAQLVSPAVLYIVGDGPLRAELEQRAHDIGIADCVRFTGAVEHEAIHQYFAACDVFCLPSYHEGFPVVNLEALASGKPIVSTDINAIAEQVTEGKNGYLVSPGDVNGLTEALDRLLGDGPRRERFGRVSREVSEKFTWDRQAEILEMHLQRIVNDNVE